MIKAEHIKQTINSLNQYTGSKWNLFAIYDYLKQSYEDITYSLYCSVCNSCGHDGCCSAARCTFEKGCLYPESNLNELKINYYTVRDMFNFLYDSDNKELIQKLDDIYDKNYDLVHKQK